MIDDCVDDSLELGWRRCSKVYCETMHNLCWRSSRPTVVLSIVCTGIRNVRSATTTTTSGQVGFTDGIKVGFGRIPSFEKIVHDVYHDLRSRLLPSSTRLTSRSSW